jgi:hypothetical protein
MLEYTNAIYYKNPMTNQVSGIRVEINGVESTVPIDPANTDYANILHLVSENKLTIESAG